jgi:hypothetical protein
VPPIRVSAVGRTTAPSPGTDRPRRSRSSQSWNRIERYGIFIAVGFLVGGRSFAYIGIAKLNLFIGEISLFLAFVHPRTRQAFHTAVEILRRPHRWHVLVWLLTLLLGLGFVEIGRGAANGEDVLTALKNLPFNYYPLLVLLGLWLGQKDRRLLERFAWALAVVNAVYGVSTVLFLSKLHVNLPGSSGLDSAGAVPLFSVNTGSAIAIIALLAFPLPLKWRKWTAVLLLANGFVMFAEQQRSELLGFAVGLFVLCLLKGNLRTFFKVGLVAVALLGVISVSGIQISGTQNRGGQVSLGGITGRLIAPFDPQLAYRLVGTRTSAYAGTVDWRTSWWSAIWRSAHQNIPTGVFGHGYGYPLQTLVRDVPAGTRTPHDIFFYALGYSGWVGVALFFGLWLYLIRQLCLSYRITGNPFGLAFACVAFGLGFFGNWFETPFGAVPTYFVVGMALAPIGGFSIPKLRRPRPGLTGVPGLGPLDTPTRTPEGAVSLH